MTTPEAAARIQIDAALERAGWCVQDVHAMNLFAAPGVAVREVPLAGGLAADYLLFVNSRAAGVVEAKPAGTTLTGVEPQSARYSESLPPHIRTARLPLPFLYESTGTETHFTNRLDPAPRSRRVFSFHRPERLAQWLDDMPELEAIIERGAFEEPQGYDTGGRRDMLRRNLRHMPPLDERGLRDVQARAIRSLEQSLAEDRPRALVQMATGSGKTVMAIAAIYRLLKFGKARRVLFLVDRANLGRQAYTEFQNWRPPDDARMFGELYNVQLLSGNTIADSTNVVITTIQRLYAMLQGNELDPEDEEQSQFELDLPAAGSEREPLPVVYNPDVPIETFDVVFTDECHRSIYNLWRQVLEYFDAYIIGLTATPSRQTFGFFNQNLVMEYTHAQAVVDRVNVDYAIYRIRTRIGDSGATLQAGEIVDFRDRLTRAQRWEALDEDMTYSASQLDRDVVAMDQIRTVVRTFKERLFTEIFPERQHVPKTLIFAKDDSHADDIVRIVREEFGEDNEFCRKITYRTTGAKPEDLLQDFRLKFKPRIVVTVDMIATGTDIKPLEIVMFMRAVKSRNFYEQMKGRGVRTIDRTELRQATPDAWDKTHFVLIDCVGVTEGPLSESPPLERKRSLSLEQLLQALAYGNVDPDTLSSVAGRLARLDGQLSPSDRAALRDAAGGRSLHDLAAGIMEALDPDNQLAAARATYNLPPDAEPTTQQLHAAAHELLHAAVLPLAANPALRNGLVEAQRRYEQLIDHLSRDEITEAGFSEQAREAAQALVTSWAAYLREHRDAIAAFQVQYSRPYAQRLSLADIKALAEAIAAPPRSWTPERLWRAYEAVDKSRVRGSAGRQLTNLVSLVRFALGETDELTDFPSQVNARFDAWLTQQQGLGRSFTPEQLTWLHAIRDQIASSAEIVPEDFDESPFAQRGGLGRAWQLFGNDLTPLLEELNRELVA